MKSEIINLSDEQRNAFNRYINLCEKYKNAWFWGENGPSGLRRAQEQRDSMTYETEVNGIKYELDFSIEISRKNVYVHKNVYKNGFKTNVRVIKTLLTNDATAKSTRRTHNDNSNKNR